MSLNRTRSGPATGNIIICEDDQAAEAERYLDERNSIGAERRPDRAIQTAHRGHGGLYPLSETEAVRDAA